VNTTAFGIISPLIPGYVVSMGATLAFAGTVTAIFSITALFTRPLSSLLGDRLNRKKLLLITLLLNSILIFMYPIVTNIVWLYPLRILHGISFSISGTVSLSLGVDFVPKERLGEGVGYLGIGQIVGLAIGSNIGIYIMENHSYTLSFIISGITVFIVGLMLLRMKYTYIPIKSYNEKTNKWNIRLNDILAVKLLPNAFFGGLIVITYGLTSSYLVLLGEDRQIGNIGLYFIINSIVVVILRPIFGKMIDRKGAFYIILCGFSFASVSMILLGLSHSLLPVLIAAALVAVGTSGTMPALQVDCIKRLDISKRTLAMGTYMIGLDIGVSSGQLFGGVISDSFGFGITFISTGILMIIGLCLYLMYSKIITNK